MASELGGFESAHPLELLKSKYPDQYEELKSSTLQRVEAPSESDLNLEVTIGKSSYTRYL